MCLSVYHSEVIRLTSLIFVVFVRVCLFILFLNVQYFEKDSLLIFFTQRVETGTNALLNTGLAAAATYGGPRGKAVAAGVGFGMMLSGCRFLHKPILSNLTC